MADEPKSPSDPLAAWKELSPRDLSAHIVGWVSAAVSNLELAKIMMDDLAKKLDGLPPEEIERVLRKPIGAFEVNHRHAHYWLIESVEIRVNAIYARHEQPDSYEDRKAFVIEFNEQLRRYSAAIAHPESGDPCILLAVASRDEAGRFTLENRVTKKRSGFYKSITELLPLKLVPDVARKEGVIERRKKGEKPPDD